MSGSTWWRRFVGRREPDPSNRTPGNGQRPDLREFVYLDEVSLRSLLSSQKGGMTDLTSEQASEGSEAAIAGTVGANPGFIAKAEITSRYQTTNSSTIQTSRKATVQSWFREFHEIGGLRIIEPTLVKEASPSLDRLKRVDSVSQLASSATLQRGELVEFRVRLTADPVFHLGTMVSEFTAMADEYPEMFAAENGLGRLQEIQPINRVLQRLLAGLVPVRAVAVDYLVVELDGVEHVAHRGLLDGLDLKSRPLEIVGVTEQEAYWKDLRRVLFSDAEFTVLARISRSGLRETWTPVKLADLFADVAPTLVDQINAASRLHDGEVPTSTAQTGLSAKLALALGLYRDSLLVSLSKSLDATQKEDVDRRISELCLRSATVSDQTSAFTELTKLIVTSVGETIEPARALELRTAARDAVGLSLFPAKVTIGEPADTSPWTPTEDAPRLLDVEFVAIYW